MGMFGPGDRYTKADEEEEKKAAIKATIIKQQNREFLTRVRTEINLLSQQNNPKLESLAIFKTLVTGLANYLKERKDDNIDSDFASRIRFINKIVSAIKKDDFSAITNLLKENEIQNFREFCGLGTNRVYSICKPFQNMAEKRKKEIASSLASTNFRMFDLINIVNEFDNRETEEKSRRTHPSEITLNNIVIYIE